MINDTILFAKLAETPLASYGSRLKGMCEGAGINTVIQLLRVRYTKSFMDSIPYCGCGAQSSLEMFCSDLQNMTPQEQEELAEEVLKHRREKAVKQTYVIPTKIREWLEEVYLEFVQKFPNQRIRDKFLAMYYNAHRFYESLLFNPQNAFYLDIDPDQDVVMRVWRLTIDAAQYLTESIIKNKLLKQNDSFLVRSKELVDNLYICHLEACNRLNYNCSGKRGQVLIAQAYTQKVGSLDDSLRGLLESSEAMSQVIFGHPGIVWRSFDKLKHDQRSLLQRKFESLYTFMADLAHNSPQQNDKLYLNQMFEFLEPYQEDRVMEYIRDNDNTPILYLILAYVRSRPTGSHMDVLARFNGFFGPEQSIEQIASSLGARRNKIVALLQNPEHDQTLSRIASYTEAKRYNLTAADWIDLTDPTSLMDDDEKALVEKLDATQESLYYALSTLKQVRLVPILDRMIGVAPEMVQQMDFASAITSLWKTKFKHSTAERTINIPDLVAMHIQTLVSEVKDMERIERVFMDLVRLIMPDLQISYPNIIIRPSQVNAEAELFRFISIMKEITLVNLFDVFTSNYPQLNIRRPIALIPVIELSGRIGYNPRKRKFMPRGEKTVKYPLGHLKDTAIEDRSWLKFQDSNEVEEPVQMPSAGIKDLTYDQITQPGSEEAAPKATSKIKESNDIKSALQAALAITTKLTEVESLLETETSSDEDHPTLGNMSNEPSQSVKTTLAVEVDEKDLNVKEVEKDKQEEKAASLETEASELTSEIKDYVEEDRKEPETRETTTGIGTIEEEHVNEAFEKQAEEAIKKAIKNEQTDIADLLEDFGSSTKGEESTVEASGNPVIEEVSESKTEEELEQVTKEPEAEAVEQISEQTIEVTDEVQTTEVTDEETSMVEENETEAVQEPTAQELEDTSEVGSQQIEEPTSEEPTEQPLSNESIQEESTPESVATKEESVSEEEIPAFEEEPKELSAEEKKPQNVEEEHQGANHDVAIEDIESSEEPKEAEQADVPAFAQETARVVPASVSIVSEDKGKVGGSGKAKKTSKDIVVVTEPQAQMSPYRQSKVIEDKKAEEEKKEKEKSKRGRKPLPKPEPDLPLMENILRLLRNSKSPMTLTNIEKSLRKAGIAFLEDEVADLIYKYDKEFFLFFTRNFIGLMEKKYNFSLFRLDSSNTQTFDYMGRAFFEFCDANGRMPFMNNEEEKFLDRWLSHLLDEKVKQTPQQMKWFRQEVVKRRGKVLNKEEWTFVENCRLYKEYYHEHKCHPNPFTNQQLYTWFARLSQTYNSLNAVKRKAFDELVEYLDQFGLFGMLD